MINTKDYNSLVQKLREFFLHKGFVEVPVQSRLSILAACEDPFTVEQFNWANEVWPLPQTGQMWLEHELLTKPNVPGYFCLSTSYRNEPNPVEGRHCLIFPMFEFELPGGIDELIEVEMELLDYLGFTDAVRESTYSELAAEYKVKELDHGHEGDMCKGGDGTVRTVFITDFPEYTSPFWNMRA